MTGRFQPFHDLPASQYEALKADIAEKGVLVPVVVTEDGSLLDGNQRRRICAELHIGCPTRTIPGEFSDAEKESLAIALNTFRRHLSGVERSKAITRLKMLGWSNVRVGEALGVDEGTVRYHQRKAGSEFSEPGEDAQICGGAGDAGERAEGHAGPTTETVAPSDGADSHDVGHSEPESAPPTPPKVIGRDGKSYPARRPTASSGSGELERPDAVAESFERRDRALYSSDSPEWHTPPDIIERVRRVLGGIDLDPCSNSLTDPNVPAAKHYDEATDGLVQQWDGRVYMNPPYGRGIDQWVSKLHESYKTGAVTAAVALVPARTDTRWFRLLRDYPVCFVAGRLRFSDADPAPFPSAAFYLGADRDAFLTAFTDLGDIYERVEVAASEVAAAEVAA